jgi:hypothetical protein
VAWSLHTAAASNDPIGNVLIVLFERVSMMSTLQKRALWGSSAGLLAVCLGGVPAARAEATPSEKVAAQTLFDEGRALVASGRFAEACPKLEESQRLDPTSGTLINLADCYEREGRTASAWNAFLEAAASAKASGRIERESAARDRAAALVPRLSKIALFTGQNDVSTLQVQCDGAPVDRSRWAGFPVDPGQHLLSIAAAGKKDFRTTVTIRADADSVSVMLPKLEDNGQFHPALAPEKKKGNTQRTLALVVGGAGVVGLGVGTVFGLISRSKHNEADNYCDGSLCRDPRGLDLKDQAISAGNVSSVAFVAGAVGVGAGAVLWFTGRPKSPAPASSSARVALIAGPGSVLVKGTF